MNEAAKAEVERYLKEYVENCAANIEKTRKEVFSQCADALERAAHFLVEESTKEGSTHSGRSILESQLHMAIGELRRITFLKERNNTLLQTLGSIFLNLELGSEKVPANLEEWQRPRLIQVISMAVLTESIFKETIEYRQIQEIRDLANELRQFALKPEGNWLGWNKDVWPSLYIVCGRIKSAAIARICISKLEEAIEIAENLSFKATQILFGVAAELREANEE